MKTRTGKQLNEMVGKTYDYKGDLHTIQQWSNGGDELVVSTSLTFIKMPCTEEAVQAFINKCEEIVPPKNGEDETALAVITDGTGTMQSIESILLDNIKKVQENAGYIPQAKAINNDVNSLINIAKTKIAFVREKRESEKALLPKFD